MARVVHWHARRLLPEHVADDDGRLTMTALLQAAQRAKTAEKNSYLVNLNKQTQFVKEDRAEALY